MSSKYKLYYFPGRGRAEFIRYILHYTNTPYEEISIAGEEWPAYKKQMPMGVVPVLELSDGRKLSQSLAIARYLATEHGLVSDDSFKNAWGDQLVGAIEDIYPVYYRDYVFSAMANDEEKKAAALKALNEKALKPLFDILEKFLGDNEYFCGNRIHWADLVIAELVDRVEKIFDKDLVRTHPKLGAHAKRILDTPNLKKYVEKRPPAFA